MNGPTASPISPSPVTKYEPNPLPAYLSNGVLGLRVRQIPLHPGVAIVNGAAGVDPVTQVSGSPYAPYPLGGDIGVEQVQLSQASQQIEYEEQRYDFSCGELHTRFRFNVNGTTAHIEILTFCSRSLPTLALQRTRIEVNRACQMDVSAFIDPNSTHGKWIRRNTRQPGMANPTVDGAYWATPHLSSSANSSSQSSVDGSFLWEMPGGLSKLGVAYSTELQGAKDLHRSSADWGDGLPLTTRYKFRGEPGSTYTFHQIVSMVPQVYHHQPDWQASRLADIACHRGFDALRQENREAWEDLWKGRVRLLGAEERWQSMVDAAFFYLHSSVHPSSASSTTPFGLAAWPNYNYYYGHVMWDLETFILPPLLLTAPDAAAALLRYRSDRLNAARDHAKLRGYRGIQFPWESDPVRGEEASPPNSSHSAYEIHVTPDVARAFSLYGYATNDENFLRQQAWPVLKGVAEWLETLVSRTHKGYEIKNVVGIAEVPKPVDNDAYTNIGAKVILEEATALAHRLGHQAPSKWADIAGHLLIPLNPKTHVLLDHDGYHEDGEGGNTPGALATLFPLPYRPGEQIERATLDHYLPLAHKYAGKPMLSALLGVYAARAGNRQLSKHLFEKGYADFVFQPFNNTEESVGMAPNGQRVGPFITNLGGLLMSCLYGLTRLRLGAGDPESWCEGPIVLPEGWEGIQVERVWVRGRPARLIAKHGDQKAQIEFLDS